MIAFSTGDLTACTQEIICHQTNFYGVMGAGVAAAIRRNLLCDEAMSAYRELCQSEGRSLLGTVQFLSFIRASDGFCGIVANCFSQDDSEQEDGSVTRYDCMRECLTQVEKTARMNGNRSVALPAYMGCGIAGGDWKTVRRIIDDVFGRSPVPLMIVSRS